MRLSAAARLSLIVPAVLTLHAARASAEACDSDAATRWVPQRAWPAACEPDAVLDGLVLLEGDALPYGAAGGEGDLKIELRRMVQGQPVETFSGKVTRPDATSALFQAEKPLAPHADYQINAQRVGLDGSPLGAPYTSAFSTQERTLPPLAFQGTPSLTYEETDSERYDCVLDGCGQKNCKPGDETVHIKSLRIAVPPVAGGVDLKPVSVSANLVASFANGQAPAVATSDTSATQAGKRSYVVLELPPLPSAAQGCVTVHVSDVAGHTLVSEPVCTALPADEQPYDDDLDQGVPLFSQVSTSVQSATSAPDVTTTLAQTPALQAAASQGCALARTPSDPRSLGWLALGLFLARWPRRRR